MLLRPSFKYILEIGTSFDCLFQSLIGFFVEIVFDGVGCKQEVQNESFVFEVFNGIADDILDMLCIIMDGFFLNVPLGLVDEIGKENNFDFVKEENFADSAKDLADGVLR